MSRKSVRIQRRKKNTIDSTEQEIIETFRRKRKADEEEEETVTAIKSKKQRTEDDSRVEPSINMDIMQRQRQFQLQNQWAPLSNEHTIGTCIVLPTTSRSPGNQTILPTSDLESSNCSKSPSSSDSQEFILGNASANTLSQFRLQSCFTKPVQLKDSPLPSLYWADSREVWHLMLRKEQLYIRDPLMLDRHTALEPRMRSVLLDWLIEVCEVYTLHRETYHLAVDFCDRFLSVTKGIHKSQLQLIGITALFVAAKLEEIYPPKLTEFAFLTDQACSESEILDQELVMLKALKWDLTPMTPNSWLNVFLQLMNIEKIEEKEHGFLTPQYSQNAFVQIARLLDLCSLDLGSLQFEYSVLATSATYHMSSEYVALSVSGYSWKDIAACVQWMAPYAMTLREVGAVDVMVFKNIPIENTHNIQTHAVDLHVLGKAQNRQTQIVQSARASPEFNREIPGIITPPQSKGKESKEECTPTSRREKVLYEAVV